MTHAAAAVELFEHPGWCDPGECTASEWFSYHRSSERKISTPTGAVEISAQLRCNAYDPLSEAPVSVRLTVAHPDGGAAESYHLDAPTIVQLHSLLGEILPSLSEQDLVNKSTTAQEYE